MRWWFLAVTLIIVTSCTAAPSEESHVDLGEFYVTVEGEPLEAGAVALTIENFGQYPHTLVISTSTGSVLAATDLIGAGEEVNLQIDLSAGAYVFTCRIVNADGDGGVIDHYQEGMSAAVAVVNPSA